MPCRPDLSLSRARARCLSASQVKEVTEGGGGPVILLLT